MRKIRVLTYGVGVVGGYIAKSLLQKKGVEIVAAVDIARDKVGRDLGEVLGLDRKIGVAVTDKLENALSEVKPDIAVHATSSHFKHTYYEIAQIVKHGINVVSTCEELACPSISDARLAEQLDALAKEHDATVLGSGINPGFLMDALAITLTAPCEKIDRICVTRVMNAATRRLPFQKKIGAGLTAQEFKQKMEKQEITGHVGLEQSIALIADALAWKIDRIVVEKAEPVVAVKPVKSKDVQVAAGKVAGLRQKAKALKRGKEVIMLDFRAYIGAEEEYDAIAIDGLPPVREKISPCVHGDVGTVAMIVNSIPKVLNAPAGLLTMKDLPLPSAAVEDMRKYVNPCQIQDGK